MRHAAKRIAISAAGLLVAAAPAFAQSSNVDSARQRYEKSTSDSSVKGFAHSMSSDDPMERLAGIKSLTDLKSDQAVDLLLQALGDQDMRVRAKAIDACGNLRATAATPVLIQQLFLKDTGPEVKERILAALGKIGDARAAQPIMEFLNHDIDKPTRGTAIFALGDLGAPESLETLDKIAQSDDDPTIQRLAREAANKVRYVQVQRANQADAPLNTFLKPEQ